MVQFFRIFLTPLRSVDAVRFIVILSLTFSLFDCRKSSSEILSPPAAIRSEDEIVKYEKPRQV